MPDTQSPRNKIEEARLRLSEHAALVSQVEAEVQAAQVPSPKLSVSKGGTFAAIAIVAVLALGISWVTYRQFRHYYPSRGVLQPSLSKTEREAQLKKAIEERRRAQKARPAPTSRKAAGHSAAPTPTPDPAPKP